MNTLPSFCSCLCVLSAVVNLKVSESETPCVRAWEFCSFRVECVCATRLSGFLLELTLCTSPPRGSGDQRPRIRPVCVGSRVCGSGRTGLCLHWIQGPGPRKRPDLPLGQCWSPGSLMSDSQTQYCGTFNFKRLTTTSKILKHEYS